MGKVVLVVDLTLNFCKLPGLQRQKQEMGTKEVFVSEVLFEGRERIAQHWTTQKPASFTVGFIYKGWYLELA